MSQRLSNSFINTNIPGSFFQISVKSNPVGIGSTGNVVIIGEAAGGDSFDNEISLKANYYTADQLSLVSDKYLSGNIVDAFRALSSPSNDSGITSTANRIYIVKTNTGTSASSTLDTDYGTLADLNVGTLGNSYKYQVTSIAAESAPAQSGTTIAAFGAALNGKSFKVRANGGAEVLITLSSTPADHANVATLSAELTALLPASMVASAGAIANSIEIALPADAAAYRKGQGRSFELIDSTPGDLAALGLAAGLTVSAQEVGIEMAVTNANSNYSKTLDVNANIALSIGYVGTSAILTISPAGMLTTTVVGGSGANLSIDLASHPTIGALASFINSQTGYLATAAAAAQQLAPSTLDPVTAIGICATETNVEPGRIKNAAYSLANAMNQQSQNANSQVNGIWLALNSGTIGLPRPMASPAYLANGALGSTSAAKVIQAIDALAALNINIIVPLFSQDASIDIGQGITDPASTYTIDAIHAATKSHCLEMSSPKLKKNRIAILAAEGSYSSIKSKAQNLASYRCSLAMQVASQVDSAGNVSQFRPWYTACVAAGMQAGGFYKAIVNKYANIISIKDPSGFDSGNPGDVEDALDAGLLFLTQDSAGNKWVSDQTTYGFDNNFVYNSIQATYDADIIALDLADSFQKAFVGQSLADVDAGAAKAFLAQKMAGYKALKLIASSSDAPLGYKNDSVTISGPVMNVQVEIKLATAIYFIPISISLSAVQTSA